MKICILCGAPSSPEHYHHCKECREYLIERLHFVDEVRSMTKWSYAKVITWFATENMLLGGTTPDRMIQIGRGHKLKKFIESARDNWPK